MDTRNYPLVSPPASQKSSRNPKLGFWYYTLLILFIICILPSCDCDLGMENEEEETTTQNAEHNNCAETEAVLACYLFNGNVNDISRFENHGFVDGAQLTTDRFGHSRSAYLFDGVDDYIEVDDSEELDLTDEFTISVWIYPTRVKSGGRIVGKGRKVNGPNKTPYWIALSNNIIYFYTSDANEEVYRTMAQIDEINKWYMITASMKDQKMYLYINGELQQVTEMPHRLRNVSNPLIIGSRLSQPSNTFAGKIDDVEIFNYALSEEEISCMLDKINA